MYETKIITKRFLSENFNINDIDAVVKSIKDIRTNSNLEVFDGHLIVDDVKSNRDILKRMLKILSIDSDTAENGMEALKKISNRNYKLIWMDIKMPILDGIKTSDYLRNELNYDGKIYAVTAYTDTITRTECKDAGINKIISKPISLKLVKEISTELNLIE